MSEPEPLTVWETVVVETGEAVREVAGWPRVTAFDIGVLGWLDPLFATIADTEVTFTVTNGQATYRLAFSECDGTTSSVPAYLVSSRFSEPTYAKPAEQEER